MSDEMAIPRIYICCLRKIPKYYFGEILIQRNKDVKTIDIIESLNNDFSKIWFWSDKTEFKLFDGIQTQC